MWKLKLASKVIGGPSLPESITGKPKSNFNKYARWAGLGTAALLLIMGLASTFLDKLWVGIYCIGISIPVAIIEFPFAPFEFMVIAINFLGEDFRFKAGGFAVISIVAFFSLPTILAALACIATGAFYVFCWFKGETAEKIEKTCGKGKDRKSRLGEDEESTNNKKKSSLASKGLSPGVV